MKFNLLTATQTLERTMGFTLQRFLICLGLGFAVVLATLIGAGTFFGLSGIGTLLDPRMFGGFGAIVGFLLAVWGLYKARGLIWNGVRYPHLCLLGAVHRGETVPEGRFQPAEASARAKKAFPVARELSRLVLACEAALYEWVQVSNIRLPMQANPYVAKVGAWVLARWIEVVITRVSGDEAAARTNAIKSELQWLFARPQLTWHSALGVSAFEFGFLLALFFLFRIPFMDWASQLPGDFGMWPQVFAMVVAWVVKAAFLEPISACSLMQVRDRPAEEDSAINTQAGEKALAAFASALAGLTAD